jgi:hypothetical protein
LTSVRTILKITMPTIWHRLVVAKKLLEFLRRSFGFKERDCLLCGYSGKFLAEIHFPDIVNMDAICPKCGSLPRNRLIGLAVQSRGVIRLSDRLLHFAPENPVRAFVEPRVTLYKTADLYADSVDLKLNIERIDQKNASWDCIICSHVLEHVDHYAALRELERILAPGGRLLALFPVVEGWIDHYEDKEIVSEHDRAIHFGKKNHLKRFGSSIREDITRAGFTLECYSATGADVVIHGLIPGEALFIASKPSLPKL